MRALVKRALGIGPTEAEIQVAVMTWARMREAAHPDLTLLHAIPNGGRRDKAEAAHLAAQGVRPGIPDLHLPTSCHSWHSLYIELKSVRGTLSPEQRRVLPRLSAAGNLVVVVRDVQAACDLLTAWSDGAGVAVVNAIAKHPKTIARVWPDDFAPGVKR